MTVYYDDPNTRLPWEYMTDAKYASLGQEMTIKEACDLGWNSVRVDGKTCYYSILFGGYYQTEGLDINTVIILDDNYEEDADGYPIVYAKIKEVA